MIRAIRNLKRPCSIFYLVIVKKLPSYSLLLTPYFLLLTSYFLLFTDFSSPRTRFIAPRSQTPLFPFSQTRFPMKIDKRVVKEEEKMKQNHARLERKPKKCLGGEQRKNDRKKEKLHDFSYVTLTRTNESLFPLESLPTRSNLTTFLICPTSLLFSQSFFHLFHFSCTASHQMFTKFPNLIFSCSFTRYSIYCQV